MTFFVAGGLCLTISAATTISFCIGSCLLFISFTEDATHDLVRLNVDEKSTSHGFEVKIRFHSAMNAYSDLKELMAFLSLFQFISAHNNNGMLFLL